MKMVEMTKDRADHKSSPVRARSVYTFLLGNPGYYYFTLVNMVPFMFHNCIATKDICD